MKHPSNIPFLRNIGLAALLITPALGQTTWYHGGFDSSATYGQTPDNSTAITWSDIMVNQIAPDANFTGANNQVLQVNRPTDFANEVALMAFNFSGLGITSADVLSAQMWVTPTTVRGDNTWQIRGLPTSNSNFDTPGSSFNSYNAPTPWAGGGNILGALTGNYGSFSTTNAQSGGFAIDVTSPLQAILDGSIGGFVFVNTDSAGFSFEPTDQMFQMVSNNNVTGANRPGLLVTAIPEPSVALLGAFGVLALLRRRR